MAIFYQPDRGVITTNPVYTDPEVFPYLPGEEFRASKTPTFSTGVRKAASGRETRNSFWSAPQYEFKITHEFLRNTSNWPEVESLLSFFNARLGKFGFFYYYDPEDPLVNNQVTGIGDATTTIFQLQRQRGTGTPYEAAEPVYAVWSPLPASLTIPQMTVTVNNEAVEFTVGPYGQLQLTNPPSNGAVIAWSGCLLYVCRFDQDSLEFEQLVSQLWSQTQGLQFLSLKP